MTMHRTYLRAHTLTLLVRHVSSATCSAGRLAGGWVSSACHVTGSLARRVGSALASVVFACSMDRPIPGDVRSRHPGHRSHPHHERDIAIPPLSQEFLDRCSLVVDRVRSGQEAMTNEHLQAIGKRVRAWRIQSGYTRATLAERLGMDPDRLLFMETGIGLPDDVTLPQLLQLRALLAGSDHGRGFGRLVQEYLVVHHSPDDADAQRSVTPERWAAARDEIDLHPDRSNRFCRFPDGDVACH